MGNGSSQSIALGPPRYSHQQAAYPSTPARHAYAHPHNRVLPLPVAGPQRLRTTDNGSILHAAGTIRGHKGQQEEDFERDDSYARNRKEPYGGDFSARRTTGVIDQSRNHNGQQNESYGGDLSSRRTTGVVDQSRNHNGQQNESYGVDDLRRTPENSYRDHRQQGDYSRRTTGLMDKDARNHNGQSYGMDDFSSRRTPENDYRNKSEFSRRTSERMVEDSYPNLRNHRMFHSDPNIARRPTDNDSGMVGYTNNNRRSYGGGAAARASNMKYKKKTRAPEPPANTSLPRHLEKRRQQQQEDIRNKNNAVCKCISKTRAPQPPSIVVHPPPPPPPPMPDSVTTRTSPQSSKSKFQESSSKSPAVTRAVECRTSYEKKINPLEKWRNCRSAGDVRIDECDEDDGPHRTTRTTVFDSRKISEGGPSKIPSYLPQKPDPFQKEIQAVTKKIAQSRQHETPVQESKVEVDKTNSGQAKRTSSPPKFYFADPSVFKTAEHPVQKPPPPVTSSASKSVGVGRREAEDETTVDEVVPSLQRFSPSRRRVRSPSQQKDEWEHLSKSLYHDSDIDVRLRPVLPRKLPDVPKFSSTEAWQSLGSDGLGSSSHSTSDEGRLSPYKRGNPIVNDRPRRFSDMDYDRNIPFHQQRSLSDSHWTPRQDLMDDSDVTSENTSDEEAVVPRLGLGEISTRFSLPTVMFSNMRPIGTEVKSSSAAAYMSDGKSSKQAKKKVAKRSDDRQVYDGGNFRRFLTKKNSKYQSEEDIAVSDSNWTFGQSGLHKRGKQYSSELLLSDKKKYELMKDNFGDFLGDILMSKSNHMRSQMKSSDSGNSNFSFYSTEGQVMYMPEKGRFVTEEVDSLPPTSKGRVYDMRKRFDANLAAKTAKKKAAELEVGRRRDLELAKMLEDEVRRRRNKEKIGIRQQLQKMKQHHPHDDDDDFDDEAYFTEPKSREEDSPFSAGSELGPRPVRFFGQAADSRLSHWQSSPALLEDSPLKNGMQSSAKGRLSMSSMMSSPEADWAIQPQSTKGVVDSWLLRQQQLQLKSLPSDRATDADVSSSSPSPATVAPPVSKKERRTNNIYKQLMDIVRKEERQLKKAQRDPSSRDSSSSRRESTPSTTSESSISTSSYSESTSAGGGGVARNGVSANREFGYRQAPPFQVNFVQQPYSNAGKAYRPVPFEGIAGCRLPGLQEEGKHIRAEVS